MAGPKQADADRHSLSLSYRIPLSANVLLRTAAAARTAVREDDHVHLVVQNDVLPHRFRVPEAEADAAVPRCFQSILTFHPRAWQSDD